MAARSPNIWILEDEVRRLSALIELLRLSYPRAAITGHSSLAAFMREIRFRSSPDILVSDLRMEGKDDFGGASAVIEFHGRFPEVPIIVYSGWPEQAHVLLPPSPQILIVEKGEPLELIRTMNSILAAKGLEQGEVLSRTNEGIAIPTASMRLGAGWILGGFIAGAGAWSATLLSVTSGMSAGHNSWAVGIAMIGGAFLGLGQIASKRKPLWIFLGSAIALGAVLILLAMVGQ